MVSFPPCKINLGLRIIRKRSDGYHDLETCFLQIGWTDILEIVISDTFSFSSSGLLVSGSVADNLCVKAYELLRKDFALKPVSIHLHKVIPMGAGLGGGSSDAAHALNILNHIFNLHLSAEKLAEYAAQLGSDCSFFLHQQPMIGTGRGEVLHPVALNTQGLYVAIVKPSVHVSTAEAYQGVVPGSQKESIESVLALPVSQWRNKLINDFELSVMKQHPIIAEVKENLYRLGALYAAMSGSGSAVFGIFNKVPNAQEEFQEFDYWEGGM